MNHRHPLSAPPILALLIAIHGAALLGCPPTGKVMRCETDDDCGGGGVCHRATGLCLAVPVDAGRERVVDVPPRDIVVDTPPSDLVVDTPPSDIVVDTPPRDIVVDRIPGDQPPQDIAADAPRDAGPQELPADRLLDVPTDIRPGDVSAELPVDTGPPDVAADVAPDITPLDIVPDTYDAGPVRPNVISMCLSYRHTCAALSDGKAYCWGLRDNGRLGDGTTTTTESRRVPDFTLPVAFESSFIPVQLTCGNDHTCALSDQGEVACWGSGEFGKLGSGNTDNSPVPVTVNLERQAQKLATGRDHNCILATTGEVKCWGKNNEAQLGVGDRDDRGDNMVQDEGGDSISELGDSILVPLGDGTVDELALGREHSCARYTNGIVQCWGENDSGKLGKGDTGGRTGDHAGEMPGSLTPVIMADSGDPPDPFVMAGLAVGAEFSFGFSDDNKLRSWGKNDHAQLAVGNTSIPVFLMLATFMPVMGTTTGIGSIDAGYYHGCLLSTDGQIKCWGWNDHGQLGLDRFDLRTVGDDPGGLGDNLAFVDLGSTGFERVSFLAAGPLHNCVVLDDTKIKCWGFNSHGQLGVGDTDNRGDHCDGDPDYGHGTCASERQEMGGELHFVTGFGSE